MCGKIFVADVAGAYVERRCGKGHPGKEDHGPWEGEAVTDAPKLGDHVRETTYGYTGRVTQIHHWCPESDAWLRGQSDRSVVARKEELWVSILVHEGGAVVMPMAHVKVVEPFRFENDYADMYFRED